MAMVSNLNIMKYGRTDTIWIWTGHAKRITGVVGCCLVTPADHVVMQTETASWRSSFLFHNGVTDQALKFDLVSKFPLKIEHRRQTPAVRWNFFLGATS